MISLPKKILPRSLIYNKNYRARFTSPYTILIGALSVSRISFRVLVVDK